METLAAIMVGLFFAVATFLMLSKKLIRILIGIAVLGNAVNLLIFIVGRLTPEVPAIIPMDGYILPAGTANPLPQALILTAIVISFSFFAFLLVLTWRAFEAMTFDDVDEMRIAEPVDAAEPPKGY